MHTKREDFINPVVSIDLRLPVWEGVDAKLFFWGHVEKILIYPALLRQIKRYGLGYNEFCLTDPEDIEHVYARKRLKSEEGYEGPAFPSDDDEYDFVLCSQDLPEAFPVTYVVF